jgi:transposase
MVQLPVGLPNVSVLGVDDGRESIEIHVECRHFRPGCPDCGVLAHLKDQRGVTLVDLPCFGKPTKLPWHNRRWRCGDPDCPNGSWTECDERIAAPRLALTDRAGRWVTLELGKFGRSVNEVADVLGCDWHTVNDAVLPYGAALINQPDRFDEVLPVREGPYRRQHFSTSIVDVSRGRLLDVVPGRRGGEPKAWLEHQETTKRLGAVRVATLDLAGS